MHSEAGRLLVFEGPDGIGKTVLTQRVSEYLNKNGVRCALMSFPGLDPGSLGRLV
jgi:thymidylate kinase